MVYYEIVLQLLFYFTTSSRQLIKKKATTGVLTGGRIGLDGRLNSALKFIYFPSSERYMTSQSVHTSMAGAPDDGRRNGRDSLGDKFNSVDAILTLVRPRESATLLRVTRFKTL